MITEDYVSFETAKLLKERGFNELTYAYYLPNASFYLSPMEIDNKNLYSQGCISAPTLQMAMKWLREVHKVYISISHRLSHNADNDVCFSFWINEGEITDGEWLSYEEACENAIRYVLENLI